MDDVASIPRRLQLRNVKQFEGGAHRANRRRHRLPVERRGGRTQIRSKLDRNLAFDTELLVVGEVQLVRRVVQHPGKDCTEEWLVETDLLLNRLRGGGDLVAGEHGRLGAGAQAVKHHLGGVGFVQTAGDGSPRVSAGGRCRLCGSGA